MMSVFPVCWASNPFSPHAVNTVQCCYCGKQSIKLGTTDTEDATFCYCKLNCGAPYCSEECRTLSSSIRHHEKLCVGPVDEAHSIYRFKLMTIESGRKDVHATLSLAAELVCCHPGVVREILEENNQCKMNEYDDFANGKLVIQSHKIICEILAESPTVGGTECKSTIVMDSHISLKTWKLLLAYVNRNRIDISISSAWSDLCEDLTACDCWAPDHPVIEEANERWGEDDDVDGPGVDMVKLMDEPNFYFPPLECSALFSPNLRKSLQHSCLPTHEIVSNRASGMKTQFQRIQKERGGSKVEHNDGLGEPMTISFVDHDDDVEERAYLLSLRGIDFCSCVRCCFERSQTEDEEDFSCFSYVTLANLFELAKKQQRHQDAAFICDRMLALNSTDASVLLDRARIAGWMGDFCSREVLLEEASHSAPEDGAIRSALAEARAYYRNEWKGIVNNSTSQYLSSFSNIKGLEERAFLAEGLLDANECAQMVQFAEAYQRELGGWTTSRHYAVPTTDVPVYQMPPVLTWFNKELERCVFPILRRQFNFAPGRLRIFDAFFVKYDAKSGQKRLPLHNDQSVYSLTIAMNPLDSYDGGGTYFAETGVAYKTDVGGMISFEGDLLHAGRNIERGARYIIACFIYIEEQGKNNE